LGTAVGSSCIGVEYYDDFVIEWKCFRGSGGTCVNCQQYVGGGMIAIIVVACLLIIGSIVACCCCCTCCPLAVYFTFTYHFAYLVSLKINMSLNKFF